MLKTRVYIIQFLGIVILLCGYLIGNQPDSKSMMYFDSDPAHPSVFSKAIKYTGNETCQQITQITDHGNTKHKSKAPRHISFDIILPQKSGYVFHPVNRVEHSITLPDSYSYLFYEEINPPPPKTTLIA